LKSGRRWGTLKDSGDVKGAAVLTGLIGVSRFEFADRMATSVREKVSGRNTVQAISDVADLARQLDWSVTYLLDDRMKQHEADVTMEEEGIVRIPYDQLE